VVWCQTKARTLRATKWIVLLGVLAVGAVLGKSALQRVFLDSEEFALSTVEIWQWEGEETPRLVNHRRLNEVTGIEVGASIFSFSLGQLEEELSVLPEVKRVRATRRLPDVLRIRVEEREPVAWIEAPKQRIKGRSYRYGMLVDAEGYCFQPTRAMFETVNDLPVITTGERGEDAFVSGKKAEGREFLRALELVRMSKRYLAEAGWSLPAIGLRNEFSLLAKTHTGTVVTFGLYEHERQLEDLVLILDHARKTSRGVKRVNLIPERNIPVVFAQAGGDSLEVSSSPLESSLDSILTRS
jgi:cell division septal protein FtsQ